MSAVFIDDEFLYAHMPQAEKRMLDQIPPERELDHHFSRRFRRKMRALIRYERRTPRMRKAVHCMKVAAAAFAVVLSLTFGALMSVEASRTRMIEIITRVLSDATSVRISVDNGAPSDRVLRPIAPTYIPKGCYVVEENIGDLSYLITYTDQTGMEFAYMQDLLAASEYLFDTEDAYTEDMMIDSQEVHLIFKKGSYQVYWYDNQYLYSLIGKLEKDEIIKMAESVITQ